VLIPKAGNPLPGKPGVELTQNTRQPVRLSDNKWPHINAMHFSPIAPVVYRQAFFLAQAKQLSEQAIWPYPGNGNAHQLPVSLAEKDPPRFSALLEFAAQKEQEHARAVRQ